MRSTVIVALVAGVGIAAAAFALRTSSVARATDTVQGPTGNITNVQDMNHLMKDPQYRETKRAEIHTRYAESDSQMAKDLGLSSDQLSQMVDLQTEFQMGVLDSLLPGGPLIRPDPAAAQATVAQQKALRNKLDADIATVLGAEKAQEFTQYMKSTPARHWVNQLQDSLLLAGDPLTAEQSKRLIAMVAAGQERHNNANDYAHFTAQLKSGATVRQIHDNQIQGDAQENASIVQAATSFMSPLQLSTLQKMLADDLDRTRQHLERSSAQFDQ
jgi:hypothetical protein